LLFGIRYLGFAIFIQNFAMATYRRFEDLEIWQLSRQLSLLIFSYTLQEKFAKDFSLKDQIKRAAGSVMDNIAEGFDRGGNKEFVNFLGFSKGSSGEVQSQLYRALDFAVIDQEQFDKAYNMAGELKNKIGGFIKYLNTSEFKGIKFKDRQ
jgi:four helix bundle protein